MSFVLSAIHVICAECHLSCVSPLLSVAYAECHLCWVSIMLSVIWAGCHFCKSDLCFVSFFWIMDFIYVLSIIILNVIVLSVIAPLSTPPLNSLSSMICSLFSQLFDQNSSRNEATDPCPYLRPDVRMGVWRRRTSSARTLLWVYVPRCQPYKTHYARNLQFTDVRNKLECLTLASQQPAGRSSVIE
jgi:hypothetical protein